MSGRAVLVTGASRGIGAAAARAFAALGDRVGVHYGASRDRAEEVVGELPGDGHALLGADLADPDAVAALVGEAERSLGGLDVLVNNAGVFVLHPPEDVSLEEWRRAWRDTLGVNLLAPADLAYHAAHVMIRQGRGGAIVNVASRGAFRGEPRAPAYGASKAALAALGQSLARALGPHQIAVSTVAPGFAETDMAAEALAGEEGARRRAESPLGRVATPEEVAAAIVYLASPEAVMSSGTVLDVNGASHLRM